MSKVRTARPLPMLLFLIPFLCLVFWSPLGEPAQTILEAIYLSTILAITVAVSRRNSDEVEIAAARLSVSVGTYVGIISTVGLLIVMAHFPSVAKIVTNFAEQAANGLPPAAAGFGLGALSAVLLMFVCTITSYAVWSWWVVR